jgi:PBSX family phage terminase large subunit
MSLKLQKPKGKSKQFILAEPSRINILHGSVRSGKTIASIIKWIHLVKNQATAECLMVGKTERTLIRNIINPMQEMLPESVIHVNKGSGELILYGKRVYLVGANDERSESKIRGQTLQYAYIDEGTIIPESFFKMLQTRLSEPNAQLYVTTNPDSPYHWMKKEIIDAADILKANIWHFTLDDNPYLDKEYIESLKLSFSGLWYQRYIEGLWVLAEGVVYPMWDESQHVRDTPAGGMENLIVSVDYGVSNPSVFLLGGIHHPTGNVHVMKEMYHNSAESGQLTDKQLGDLMDDFTRGVRTLRYITVDPSATSFIAELRSRGYVVREAVNDVIPGIQEVSRRLSLHTLFIDPSCHNMIQEFGAYVWDENAQKRGEDKPKKTNDHCSDTLRYLIMEYAQMNRVEISRPSPGMSTVPRGIRSGRSRKTSPLGF